MLLLAIKIQILNLTSVMGEWFYFLCNWLYNWQTLAAGLLALGAAWWTVKHLKEQINLQREALEEDKRRYADSQERKRLAAKAALPDALDDLYGFAKNCAQYFANKLLKLYGLDPISNSLDKLPNFPIEAISIVKTSIEFVDPQSAERLFEIAVHYQVHNARLQRAEDSNWAWPVNNAIVDALMLCSMAERLFDFARNREKQAPETTIQKSDIANNIMILREWLDSHRSVFDELIKSIDIEFSD